MPAEASVASTPNITTTIPFDSESASWMPRLVGSDDR
jgi:hypothetical protein